MEFLTGLIVVVAATFIATWVNDHSKIGAAFTDESLEP